MKPVPELLGSKKFLAMLSAIVVYGVGRFVLDITPEKLDPIWQIILVYIGAQGVADAGKSAAQVRAAAPAGTGLALDPNKIASAPPGMFTGSAAALLVVLALGLTTTQVSCAGARPRIAAGVGAMVDCQEDNLRAVATGAYELAEAALLSTIAGDGKTVDRGKLKTALAGLKSDGLRCAVVAAAAALTDPTPPEPASAVLAPRAVAATLDGAGGLRAAIAATATELGWPSYRVSP